LLVGFRAKWPLAGFWLRRGSKQARAIDPHQECPPWRHHWLSHEEGFVFIIGIDPHRGSHTAAVLDRTETVIGELRVSADRQQRDQLLEFAASFTPRTWAIGSASGLGALLAQQLVGAGETVLDVPPTLSARVRLVDSGCTDKTDRHVARAAAIVALGHSRLRQVTPVDHTAVLGLLADRHHDLTGLCTQAICRLHALLCGLTPGGAGRLLSASQARRILRGVRPAGPVEIERKRMALELLGDVCRFDNQLLAINERIVEAVVASGTTVTDIHGSGPLGAAIISGHTGDIDRFATSGHFARYTDRPDRRIERAQATAPAQPGRQPTTEPGAARRRGDPGTQRHSPTCLLAAKARRGKEHQGSAAGPQAPDRQDRLPAPGRQRPPLTSDEPGRATGTTHSPA
jgi:transposase